MDNSYEIILDKFSQFELQIKRFYKIILDKCDKK